MPWADMPWGGSVGVVPATSFRGRLTFAENSTTTSRIFTVMLGGITTNQAKAFEAWQHSKRNPFVRHALENTGHITYVGLTPLMFQKFSKPQIGSFSNTCHVFTGAVDTIEPLCVCHRHIVPLVR